MEVLFLKARILCEEEVYLQALPIIDRLTRLYPTEGTGWRMKALALFKIKELVDAERAINRALEIDPNDGDVLMLKAGIVESMGRKGEARALVKKATQVDPHNELAQEVRSEMRQETTSKVAHASFSIIGAIIESFFVGLVEFIKAIFRSY